jgi:D-sedoheptulose 7-phosphate isomerase
MCQMVNFGSVIQKSFADAASNMAVLAADQALQEQLVKCAEAVISTYKDGGCLFACGNGGSAADAQHLVAELVSKLSKDRTPIRAFAMTVDTSILTAIGNDYGYELAFDRQVRGLMRKEDVLFAITTSGNSPNILAALKACKDIGAKSILLTGNDGGRARELADHVLIAPGKSTGLIQESHIVMYHTLCYLIECGLVESGHCRYL